MREVADQLLVHRAAKSPDARNEATILDDGMDAAGFGGQRQHGARLVHGCGQWLLGQDMASVTQACGNNGAAGAGNDDVEQDIRGCLLQDISQIGADDGILKPEFSGERTGRCRIDVDQANDTDGTGKVRI